MKKCLGGTDVSQSYAIISLASHRQFNTSSITFLMLSRSIKSCRLRLVMVQLEPRLATLSAERDLCWVTVSVYHTSESCLRTFSSPRFRVLPVSLHYICSNKVRLQRHSSGALSAHLVVRANFACLPVSSHENARARNSNENKRVSLPDHSGRNAGKTHPLETDETSLSNPSTLIPIKREKKLPNNRIENAIKRQNLGQKFQWNEKHEIQYFFGFKLFHRVFALFQTEKKLTFRNDETTRVDGNNTQIIQSHETIMQRCFMTQKLHLISSIIKVTNQSLPYTAQTMFLSETLRDDPQIMSKITNCLQMPDTKPDWLEIANRH